MSTSTAELTLIINARNLAGSAIAQFQTQMGKVASKAQQIVGAFKKAFAGFGSIIGMAVGNLAYDLEHGQSWDEAFRQFGLTMAVLAAATFAENMGGQIAAKIAAAPIVAAIGVQLTALGAAIGGVIDAGIGIGMAALPFVLIAAIIAAIAILIFNEDIRNKVIAFAGQMISNIVTGLSTLAGALLGVVGGAIQWLADHISPFVGGLAKAILDALASLPGRIADLIRKGLMAILPIDIGPLHITMQGVTLDLPDLTSNPQAQVHGGGKKKNVGGSQGGGWVGMNGPELRWVGEHNPEYVHPEHGGGKASSGFVMVAVSKKDLARMLNEQLFFTLQRGAPTQMRP